MKREALPQSELYGLASHRDSMLNITRLKPIVKWLTDGQNLRQADKFTFRNPADKTRFTDFGKNLLRTLKFHPLLSFPVQLVPHVNRERGIHKNLVPHPDAGSMTCHPEVSNGSQGGVVNLPILLVLSPPVGESQREGVTLGNP